MAPRLGERPPRSSDKRDRVQSARGADCGQTPKLPVARIRDGEKRGLGPPSITSKTPPHARENDEIEGMTHKVAS